MLEEFRSILENRFPVLREQTFLLACSGGVDSMVLAHLCDRNGLEFSLAHCNFQLRGTESDADEEFVREFAKKINRKIYVTKFDTIGYVHTNKVSIEMAARELRYPWFAEIMVHNAINTLLTAHHADDNLETFLINLSRGTGIDGLLGIPERTETIARPLLQFSRKHILKYAKEEGIMWREDGSNLETKYLRNKIRHQIVPVLKELHPTFLLNFQNTQEYLAQTAGIAKDHIENLKTSLFQKDGDVVKIKIASLLDLRPTKAYLHALLNPFGFMEWDDVEGLLTAMSGKEVRSATHRLIKHREYILLRPIQQRSYIQYKIRKNDDQIQEPLNLVQELVPSLGEVGQNVIYVDKDLLQYPLVLRKWRQGDRFRPFGMRGAKKVSKFFKDEKMDIFAKENQWLLVSGEEIVWIIGKRGDDRFKVTEKTRSILKIEVFP